MAAADKEFAKDDVKKPKKCGRVLASKSIKEVRKCSGPLSCFTNWVPAIGKAGGWDLGKITGKGWCYGKKAHR